MEKTKKSNQLAILGAGVFANLVMAIIFFFMWWILFSVNFVPAGAIFNAYSSSAVNISNINSFGGYSIKNPTNQGLIDLIDKGLPIERRLTDKNISLAKFSANGNNYYFEPESLKKQLKQETDEIYAYNDFPAINADFKGNIIEIDRTVIKTYSELSEIMQNYSPGEKVKFKTNYKGEILEYNLKLAEDPKNEGRAIIGIGNTLMSSVNTENRFAFFKEEFTYYESKYDILYFLYYVVFWVFLLNSAVALFNMLPLFIFDGGRFFYLTIWGITKNEKIAKQAYKWVGILILASMALLMVVWVISVIK